MPSLDRPVRRLSLLLLAGAALAVAAPGDVAGDPLIPAKKKKGGARFETSSVERTSSKKVRKAAKHARRRGGKKEATSGARGGSSSRSSSASSQSSGSSRSSGASSSRGSSSPSRSSGSSSRSAGSSARSSSGSSARSSSGSSSRGATSTSPRSTPTFVSPSSSSGTRSSRGSSSSSPSSPSSGTDDASAPPYVPDRRESTAPERTTPSPYERPAIRRSPFRAGSPLFAGEDRASSGRREAPASEDAGDERAVDITTFGADRRTAAPPRTPTRRERLARAYRDSFAEQAPSTSKARERWLLKMREDAAGREAAEQADEPPVKPEPDGGEGGTEKKKKSKKEKHLHHDHVWHDGPGAPGWWKCGLWKGSFHGPLAYHYPSSCSWYPYWFGHAPCWSPSWWCQWWPLYSLHPGYVHCVPTYVPVYDEQVVTYYPYDEVDVVEEFVPADGALPAEGVDPLLEAELRRLAAIEEAVAFLEEGARLFQDGLYAEATDAFRRAMLAAPDNAIPKFAMANGLFALGEYGYAAFLLRRGLEILPTWPSAGPDLRELYGDEDDLLEQQIALEVTVEALPEDPDPRLLNGYVAFFTGDLDTAEREFAVLLALVPDDRFALAFLARVQEIRRLLAEEGVTAEGYDDAPPPPPLSGG